MRLEGFLEEKKRSFDGSAGELSIEKFEMMENYLWRESGKSEEMKAMAFVVHNEENGHRHVVVLTKKNGEWKMWCGDKWVEKEWNVKANKCFASKWENKRTGAICKHQIAVCNYLLNLPLALEKSEKFLDDGVEKKREKSVSKDVLRIGWEKKLPVLLYGRTGAGKSHSIFQLIKQLKEEGEDFEVFQINMSSGVEDVDMIVKILPNTKEKSWITLDGELKKAFLTAKEKPVIVFIEELTRASKSARNLLLKAIDPVSGSYTLFDFIKGETISVPLDRIWWIATANLNYSDTDDIDPALLRRFVLTKYVDYDTEAERKMLMGILEDEELVDKTMKMTRAIRKLYERGEIPQPLDTGSLKVFAELLKEIQDPEFVAEMTFLYRIVDVDATSSPSKEQIETLREIIKKIFE